MGLRNWLIKKLVKKQMKKLNPSINSDAADELLKRTLEKYTDTLKTAEKINKANLLSVKTRQLKEEVRAGLDDDEDDDEEEQEEDDDEVTTLFKNVVLPLITNKDKLANIDTNKLASFAAAIPPEELESLLKKLNLR